MNKIDTNIVWQIGIVVEDVEETTKKVKEIFEFDQVAEVGMNGGAAYDKANVIYYGEAVEGSFKGAFYDFGSVEIEFISPVGEGPSVWKDWLHQHGSSIHHIAWKVADTDKTKEYLESKGIKLMQRGNWATGTYAYYDALDMMGMIIETLEFNEERKSGNKLVDQYFDKAQKKS